MSTSDIVGSEGHRFIDFPQALCPQLNSPSLVVGGERRSGFEDEAGTVPHHRFGMSWILAEHPFARVHAARKARGVAAEPGKEVRADKHIESICRLRAGLQRGQHEREQPREHGGQQFHVFLRC